MFHTRKVGFALVTFVILCLGSAAINRVSNNFVFGQKISDAGEEAFFMFDYPPNEETFIFKLTDPEKIKEARAILSGEQTDRTHVSGIIVKESVGYNPPWSFHLDPQSIAFFFTAIEVCDATIQSVEDHLEEVGGSFLPGSRWCPWGSRLLKEIPPPVPSRRVCLQDDRSGDSLQFNSFSGDYQFTACTAGGLTLSGRGSIRHIGRSILLQDLPRAIAIYTPRYSTGEAAVRVPGRGRFLIYDSSTTDSTCTCH